MWCFIHSKRFAAPVRINYSLAQCLARQPSHGGPVHAILNILSTIVNANSLAIFWVVEGKYSPHYHSAAHF